MIGLRELLKRSDVYPRTNHADGGTGAPPRATRIESKISDASLSVGPPLDCFEDITRLPDEAIRSDGPARRDLRA